MPETEKITNIDINLLTPNRYQPRKVFNEESIKELASSIKEYGIINPILVRKNDNQYEIIAGERRWRAAISIGLSQVPVIIKQIEEQKMAELALIENLQRENLTPIDEAKSLKQIMNLANITQESLGKMLGKSQSAIANKLRLLSLPIEIQEALNNKKISERHARSLLAVEDANRQIELLNKTIAEKMSVRDLDEIISQDKSSEKEMKLAISDIMTSIKQNNDDDSQIEELIKEKEEKESDNMNNGNFFPNFNNQMNPNQTQNLNTSLNSLNIQSANTPMSGQVNETVMPTPEINSNPNVEIMPPLYNTNDANPIPNFAINNNPDMNNQPVSPESVSNQQNVVMPETPIFNNGPTIEAPQFPENQFPDSNLNNINSQESANFSSIVQDAPLFSVGETLPPMENVNEPVAPQNVEPQSTQTTYEVPVMSEPAVAPTVDNLTKTTEFLNQANIPYKLYSNETGSCIIIEL